MYINICRLNSEEERAAPTPAADASLIELPTYFNPTVVVTEFVASTASTLALPVSLTSTERSEMHQLAQHLGLEHVSRGVAENRFITLAKPGVIVGEPNLRKTMSSELIVLDQEKKKFDPHGQKKQNILHHRRTKFFQL
jgi:hypothetical protein